MEYLYEALYILWFLSEVLLGRLRRSGGQDQQQQGKRSLTYIWVIVMTAVALGVTIAYTTHFPIDRTGTLPHIAIGIFLVGVVIRYIAILSLGRMFTVDVAIREGHRVKTDGIYRHVRHPSYTGVLLCFVGFSLHFNNWISLPVILLPSAAIFLYRINVEEAALLQAFGAEYEAYKRRTYRLIPWVY